MKLFKAKEVKKAELLLIKINKLEEDMKLLTDDELKEKTTEFKAKVQEEGETLESIRVEAFAVAREATWRVLEKRPFDVQMLGGLILDMGSVAEMKTGEGKTITSIAPVYLNALLGKGVLVSTVNEYLTERDAIEMGEVHNFLGLTVGINKTNMQQNEKREAYHCDITYSVHSEIGFDYLRDNMVKSLEEKVQREFNFVLIDEVDSILIDEAKTPLIISGGDTDQSSLYESVDRFVKILAKEDYKIDWESKAISLTGLGVDKANKVFGIQNIYDFKHSELVHRIQNSLRANYVMFNNGDYIVRDGKIELVDQFTGRIMDGRSYSAGLQQAIQAKEGVEIEDETQTLATVTYQNLFRMFKKLSGMTGTAKTEESEFIDIYNMRVHEIPTNEPLIRKDNNDYVYISKEYKYAAIVKEIQKRVETKQPVLIGTSLVEESEELSELFHEHNIKHTVLNAKQNLTEAEIISQAGELGAITIATNMAGRGTDIKIDDKVKALGGLFVLGTDRAEARRIDNQLRGRSGRQGDPGESRFFISLDDALISRFSAKDKLKKTFKSFGEKPIDSKSMTRALIRAQKKIEGFNFDARKNVLQYDDVIRQQRDVIYNQRDIIIGHGDLFPVLKRMMNKVSAEVLEFEHFLAADGSVDFNELTESLNNVWFGSSEFTLEKNEINKLSIEEVQEHISKHLLESYEVIRADIQASLGEEGMHDYEREILLNTFDSNWQLQIDQMDKLRSSSSLSSYAQKNPFQVYTEKGAELFEDLIKRISHNTIRALMINRFSGAQARQAEIELINSMEEEQIAEQIQNHIKNFASALKMGESSKEDAVVKEENKQTSKDKPAAKKPVAKKPVAKKPVAKKPVAKKPVAKKPVAKKPVAKKPAAKKPVAKKPVAKKPVAKKPVAKKPVAKKPVAKKPVAKKPVAKKPVAKKPVAKKPVAKKPVAKKPVAKKPVAKKPVAKKPVAKKPVAKKPVAKKPVAKKPVAKKPVAKKPVAKKPVAKKPVAKKPVAKKPVAKKPVAKKPVAKKPVAKKPTVKTPIKEKHQFKNSEIIHVIEEDGKWGVFKPNAKTPIFTFKTKEEAIEYSTAQTHINKIEIINKDGKNKNIIKN